MRVGKEKRHAGPSKFRPRPHSQSIGTGGPWWRSIGRCDTDYGCRKCAKRGTRRVDSRPAAHRRSAALTDLAPSAQYLVCLVGPTRSSPPFSHRLEMPSVVLAPSVCLERIVQSGIRYRNTGALVGGRTRGQPMMPRTPTSPTPSRVEPHQSPPAPKMKLTHR